jgi:hypothetical protein
MAYTQTNIASQYSVILGHDGSVSSIRLHTRQQVSDSETGEVINDKMVITTIVDLASEQQPDAEQLELFLKRVNDQNGATGT